MSESQVTLANPVAAIRAPHGIRRNRIGRGRILALALATVSAIGAMGAMPQATRAATMYGANGPAYVWCLSGPAFHTIHITPEAYPADGLWNQQILYRYWIYSYTQGRYFAPIPATGTLSMVSYANGMGMPTTTVQVPAGNYKVLVEYWWPTTSGAYSYARHWTEHYQQNAWNALRTDGYCNA
jgi:hypothetical protein